MGEMESCKSCCPCSRRNPSPSSKRYSTRSVILLSRLVVGRVVSESASHASSNVQQISCRGIASAAVPCVGARMGMNRVLQRPASSVMFLLWYSTNSSRSRPILSRTCQISQCMRVSLHSHVSNSLPVERAHDNLRTDLHEYYPA